MADRIPGVMGINPLDEGEVADGPGGAPGAGFVDPGPNGTDPPSPMVARIIAKVDDDWHPPNPDTSPEVEIDAETLADVGDVLKKMDEWGKGGGKLRSEAIPVGTSTNLTVKLQGNLLRRLPKWLNYSKASSAAKKEWDRMLEKLKAHEQRHMEIAIEHGDALAKELIGNDIDKIVPMVTARNAQMAKDQKKMDDDTDHGKKKGVPYGDVTLDTSIE